MTHPKIPDLVMHPSLDHWTRGKSLSQALELAESGVRESPQDTAMRWRLVEWLCVFGQWERALKQLQAWALLSRDTAGTAQVMRGLIRAEHQRGEVFAGRAGASLLTGATMAPPVWMAELRDALQLSAIKEEGAIEAASLARHMVMARLPDTPGTSNLVKAFSWIRDSDTRLGPVCELSLAGSYRWLAFSDIATVVKAAPASVLDLVWSPAHLMLRDGTSLRGHLPTRYPMDSGDIDELLAGRRTEWLHAGREGVYARGQKVWVTDAGNMPLQNIRRCTFSDPAA